MAEKKCKNGHLLTPENTYVYPGGKKRQCRICSRASHVKWNKKPRSKEVLREGRWRSYGMNASVADYNFLLKQQK